MHFRLKEFYNKVFYIDYQGFKVIIDYFYNLILTYDCLNLLVDDAYKYEYSPPIMLCFSSSVITVLTLIYWGMFTVNVTILIAGFVLFFLYSLGIVYISFTLGESIFEKFFAIMSATFCGIIANLQRLHSTICHIRVKSSNQRVRICASQRITAIVFDEEQELATKDFLQGLLKNPLIEKVLVQSSALSPHVKMEDEKLIVVRNDVFPFKKTIFNNVKTPILIFLKCNSVISEQCLLKMLSPFADTEVGCAYGFSLPQKPSLCSILYIMLLSVPKYWVSWHLIVLRREVFINDLKFNRFLKPSLSLGNALYLASGANRYATDRKRIKAVYVPVTIYFPLRLILKDIIKCYFAEEKHIFHILKLKRRELLIDSILPLSTMISLIIGLYTGGFPFIVGCSLLLENCLRAFERSCRYVSFLSYFDYKISLYKIFFGTVFAQLVSYVLLFKLLIKS